MMFKSEQERQALEKKNRGRDRVFTIVGVLLFGPVIVMTALAIFSPPPGKNPGETVFYYWFIAFTIFVALRVIWAAIAWVVDGFRSDD